MNADEQVGEDRRHKWVKSKQSLSRLAIPRSLPGVHMTAALLLGANQRH